MLRSAHVQCLLIVLAYVVAFLLLHERWLSAHDPANFVLALKYGYSVADQRPHPPGYPGFYVLWKEITALTHLDPHSVILLGNLIFGVVALWITYAIVARRYGSKAALLTILLIATNPLFLYYSFIGEIYAYDAAYSAFLVLLLLKDEKRYDALLYFVLGLLGAFRLSSIVLTAPVVFAVLLWDVLRKQRSWKSLVVNVVAFVVGFCVWLIPFVYYLGGWKEFQRVFADAAYLPTTLAQNLSTFIPFMLWMLNAATILLILRWRSIVEWVRSNDAKVISLLLIIIVPACFFALKYYAKGYALLYIVPFAILTAFLVTRYTAARQWSIALVATNLLLFFCAPFMEPSAHSALNHEHRTSGERWQTALLRGTSYYAPTLAHIRLSDRSIRSVESLLKQVSAGVYVWEDGAATRWAYPRTLQALFPEIRFLMPEDSVSNKMFAGPSMNYSFYWTEIPVADTIYYLTMTDFEAIMPSMPGARVGGNGDYSLRAITSDKRAQFIAYVNSNFVRSEE